MNTRFVGIVIAGALLCGVLAETAHLAALADQTLQVFLPLITGKANAPATSGPAFYVATTGDDDNPGTLAAPWRTIQKAANSATTGSTVYVRGGTYNERVTVRVSGAAGSPIVFQSYPGEQATIDGAGLAQSEGMVALIDLGGQSYVAFQGFELRNNVSSNSGVVPVGIAVSSASAGVALRNNRVHDIATTVGGDAHGIAVYGNAATPISNLVVDGNELSDLKLGSSEALVVNGNVDGFAITGNLVHNVDNIAIDAIGYEGVAPANDRARNGVIARNRVWRVDSSANPAYGATCSNGVCSGGETSAGGIYVDGGTQIIIDANTVIDANIGIELASEHAGKSTDTIMVRNNIVANVDYAGIALGGYGADTSAPGGGSARNNTIVNNTVYTPAKGSALVAQYRVSTTTIANNIFAARDGAGRVVVSGDTFVGNTEANNLIVTATNGSPNPNNLFVAVARPSDAALRDGTGSVLQRFLHIVVGSAATNAGGTAALSGATDIDEQARVQGGAIDIGADEAS